MSKVTFVDGARESFNGLNPVITFSPSQPTLYNTFYRMIRIIIYTRSPTFFGAFTRHIIQSILFNIAHLCWLSDAVHILLQCHDCIQYTSRLPPPMILCGVNLSDDYIITE